VLNCFTVLETRYRFPLLDFSLHLAAELLEQRHSRLKPMKSEYISQERCVKWNAPRNMWRSVQQPFKLQIFKIRMGVPNRKKRRRSKSDEDPLLARRVEAILEGALDVPPTSDNVVEILRQRHHEYTRKSKKQLITQVSAIIIDRKNEESAPPSPEADKEDTTNLLNASLYKRAKSIVDKKVPKEKVLKDKIILDPALQPTKPTTRFSDMGGIESCLQDIVELCEYPLLHPELYRHLGVQPPRGILLHGPPGCGKTMLARAIAGELDVAFFSVAAPEIVSGMSGESEEKLRKLFVAAKAASPSIVFIDEIDAITAKRETSTRGMEKRIVAQLLTCMDSLGNEDDDPDENTTVIVIGATNRADSLDSALRRAGRFDREISIGVPDTQAREKILKCIVAPMRLSGEFDLQEIARLTPGYVGADLDALAKEAAVIAVNRVFSELHIGEDIAKRTMARHVLRSQQEPFTEEQMDPVYVNMSDFCIAVTKVQPSAKREGFATVPSVTWDDIGSLANVSIVNFIAAVRKMIVFWLIFFVNDSIPPTHSELQSSL